MPSSGKFSPNGSAVVEIVHFADPWCWWSWGLEPVLQRLKEVYGNQAKVTYRMGGMAESIGGWRKEYDVSGDEELRSWINDSLSLTKIPTDPDYILKTHVKSSWPSCIAVKAAQLQDEEKAAHYLRRMIEAVQVESRDASDEKVYLPIAKEVGLDTSQLVRDIRSGKASEVMREDKKSMDINFLTLSIVNRKSGKRKNIGDSFTGDAYESVIDQLTGKSLTKKKPLDILEYFERHSQNLVSAREIAVIFGITEEGAMKKLEILTKGELLKKQKFSFGGTFYKGIEGMKRDKLTMKEVDAAHVSETQRVSSEADLNQIVTKAVTSLYTEVASNPTKTFHFPLGRKATLFVGYPKSELDKIPKTAVESFAGVGYPHASNAIKPGDTVLDIGSGSGTDVLVASLRTGPKGKVIGVDMTDAMIKKARDNASKMGAKNVKIVKGDATKIPVDDQSVDVVTSNGVLNLVTDKKKAFKEINRVLKWGGRIQIADIVVQKDVQKVCGLIPQLWADCIGGAAVENEYVAMIKAAGFKDTKILNKLDYFSKSSSDNTKRLTKSFGAETIVITAIKRR